MTSPCHLKRSLISVLEYIAMDYRTQVIPKSTKAQKLNQNWLPLQKQKHLQPPPIQEQLHEKQREADRALLSLCVCQPRQWWRASRRCNPTFRGSEKKNQISARGAGGALHRTRNTTCTQLLPSEPQSSVWLNIRCQPPPFHSKTNWTAASSRRWGDITPAASWLVVLSRCGPTGCSSNRDAPVRSHGCRMKCHRRPHSRGAGFVRGLCGPHVQISGKISLISGHPRVWAWSKLIGWGGIMQAALWGPRSSVGRETWKSTYLVIASISLPLIYFLFAFQEPGNACQTSHPITAPAACIAALHNYIPGEVCVRLVHHSDAEGRI